MRIGLMMVGTLAAVNVALAGELPELAPKAPPIHRAEIRPHWQKDGFLWYRNDLARAEKEFVLVDPENRKVERFSETDWKERPKTYRRPRRRSESTKPPGDRLKSPDGKWEAFARKHDLWIRRLDDDTEHQLTTDGSARNTFRFDAVQERGISMKYSRRPESPSVPDVYWSPDSKRLIALQTRVVAERKVHYLQVAPKDQLQPRLHSYPYLKPGDAIPQQRPRLFDIESRKELPVDNRLFEKPWRLSRFHWRENPNRFVFLYNQRGHQVLRLLAINATNGAVNTLVEEQSKTFIDYAYKSYLRFLKNDRGFIWMSERDGWNHLYLYDSKGGLQMQITEGKWMVRRVRWVDEEKRQVWFDAMGILPGQDPYHVHHCRVDFDGSGLTVLTKGDGTHEVQFSPDRTCFIDKQSRADLPPIHTLLCKLEQADVGEWKKAGNEHPIRFTAKGRDGQTDIHGVIQRPWNFDPKKKYPVIEYIYAGPHSYYSPKTFRHDYTHRRDLLARGFVIVQMDGMGTNWRGKKFHDVCWKNIGDAGFPDRIRWIKAAAKTRPWMDLSRVGIYGGSAGGQNAMRALIAHADFYHAAVADCGCHDNRMDKIWWNEAWMGYPIGSHYKESSNVDQAHRLKGELLLMLGGEDRNVDPASTIQVVDALVEAGKDFEFVLQPSRGHGSAESTYGKKRRLDFFLRHLHPDR